MFALVEAENNNSAIEELKAELREYLMEVRDYKVWYLSNSRPSKMSAELKAD